nr:Dihydrofolate reductase [uncultured bacterium]
MARLKSKRLERYAESGQLQKEENMNDRMISIIGAFDRNGVFGIGEHLPWSGPDGRSLIRMDMGRFVQATRDTVFGKGKQNVLVIGRGSMDAMGWRPLPRRHTIVLSQTINQKEANEKVPEGKRVWVARNAAQALETALSITDCGHVFFGGGETVWLEALKSGLCNRAFITMIECDTVAASEHKGTVRKLPEMLLDETFEGMQVEHIRLDDTWGDREVMLDFRNYEKA